MVRENAQARVAIHRARENEAQHGSGRLDGPAERPPDLVRGEGLAGEVSDLVRAPRVQEGRHAAVVEPLEQRAVDGGVDGRKLVADVDLHAKGAELLHGAGGLGEGGLLAAGGRERRHEAAEDLGVRLGEGGHLVVGAAREVAGRVAGEERLDGRRGQRWHLPVLGERGEAGALLVD